MRPVRVVAAAFVAAAALPAHAEGPALPRLWLSAHVLRHGDDLVIRGSGCPASGLGNGYGAYLFNGPVQGKRPDEAPDTDAAGNWRAVHHTLGMPAGHWALRATCYKAQAPNDPKYPAEDVLLLPSRSIVADGPLEVSDDTVQPGQSVTVAGEFRYYGFNIGVFFDDTYLASLPNDTDERHVTGTVRIPAGAEPGRHRLLAQGPGEYHSPRSLVAYVTVPAPPTTPPPSPSPSPTPTPTPTPRETPLVTDEPSPSATSTALLVSEGDGGMPTVPLGITGGTAVAAGAAGLVLRRRARR